MEIGIIVACLITAGFFSGMEIAFFSANRLKIELSQKRGSSSGKLMYKFLKNPSDFIITNLIGINIAVVTLSLTMSKILEPVVARLGLPEFGAVIFETLISTFLILVLSEFIPKILFRVYADTLLPLLIFPFYILYLLLKVVVLFLSSISKLTLRLFGVKVDENKVQYTVVDLEKFIKDHSPEEDEEQQVDTEMFENALYLENIKVRECMVPRKEIVAVEVGETIDQLLAVIIESNHSRILVYKETIDNILGYVHHFDMHNAPKDIASIIMPIGIVPETMALQHLLNHFIKENKSISWVVDEYGGTAGIITLEDILEEIFGEIKDEYDNDELIESQLSQNDFILSGRLEVEHINEQYHLRIPEGDYETLSGFIISHAESIPEKDEIITIEQYEFKILDVSDTKIETVKLTILENNAKE
ncbi:MAG: hemolysin family protein [Chitinophagales bacterium]|nr:hemolysin family protein [Chitinophagales bacterium]